MFSPVRLTITDDGEMIRAFFVMDQRPDLKIEASALRRAVAVQDPEAFEIWRDALEKILVRWTERNLEAQVTSVHHLKSAPNKKHN